MTRKYYVGEVMSIEAAMFIYEKGGDVIVTDGKFVQVEKQVEEE